MAGESRVGATTQRTARNVVVRATAEVLGKVATLAWTVVVARMLSVEDFGAVTYALSLMLLVSSLPSWGFDNATIRRGSTDPDRLERIVASTQVWKSVLAVPVFATTALVASFGRPTTESVLVLVLFLLAGFPELWSHTARSASSARQSPGGTSSALVVQRIATAVAVLLAAAAGWGVVGVAAGFLVGSTVGWLAHVVALRRLNIRPDYRGLDRAEMAATVHKTFLLGLSGLVLVALFRLDVLLLEMIQGDAAVATYSVAYRLLETVLFVAYAINQSIFPVISATQNLEKRAIAYARALSVAGFIYLPFAAVALIEGEALIDLLFGERYAAEAGPILAVLAPAALLFAMAYFASTLLMAAHLNAVMFVGSVAALVLNVGLNVALIPSLGGLGAAIATGIAYVVQLAVSVVALRRRGMPLPLLRPFLLPGIAAAILAVVLWLLPTPVLVDLVVGGAVYLAVWFGLAARLAPTERDLVLDLVGSKLKRRR